MHQVRGGVRYSFELSVMEQPATNGDDHGAAEQPAADDHQDLGQSFSPLCQRSKETMITWGRSNEITNVNTEKSFARERESIPINETTVFLIFFSFT